MSDNVLAALLLIALPVAIVLIVSLTRYFISRERIRLIEKSLSMNVELKPELIDALVPKTRKSNLNVLLIFSVVLIGIGIGTFAGVMILTEEAGVAILSGIPLLIGIGLLAAYIIIRRSGRE